MATRIYYEVLYGETSKGPACSTLEIDGFLVLLDCGWDDHYDTELLKPIEKVIDRVDAVVISHPDQAHLGALPYLVGKLKLQAPIYATVPCHKMGQMFMYDQFLSRQQSSDFDIFSLDDVDLAFQRMRQLKYQQQVKLSGKGEGMSLTAFAAGHLVGGAIWQLLTRDGEQLVYAVHWNHRKDRHLRRADLDPRFSRPALFITDACSAQKPVLDAVQRDQEMLARILATLNAAGNVLIPSDTAGRSLELALLLEHAWRVQRLSYTIVFLTPVAYSTIEFAKSQLEWMNQDISEAFNKSRGNPFEFRHVRICHSKDKLWGLPPGPKVVLASMPSLATGMSPQLLVDWGPNPNNLILFPGQASEGTIAALLQKKPKGSREALQIQMQLGRRVPLQGQELRDWQEAQRATEAEESTTAVQQAISEADTNPAPEFSVQLEQTREKIGSQNSKQLQSSLPHSDLLHVSAPRKTLIDGFKVPKGAAGPMFPHDEEDQAEWTDYGAPLKPGEFRRINNDHDTMDIVSEDEDEESLPTKIVSSKVDVNVRAQVETFDYEGLSDMHSIQTLLTNVAPRHLILAYGTCEDKEFLQTACTAQPELQWQVHTSKIGQRVDASSGSSSYRANVSDQLLKQLNFRNMGNYQVAWLNATVSHSASEGTLPELVPAEIVRNSGQEGSIFIGDAKLSTLHRILGGEGISAEFSSGMLVCQSRIVIKSEGVDGHLSLQGPLCSDYYAIRDIIYSQYHVC